MQEKCNSNGYKEKHHLESTLAQNAILPSSSIVSENSLSSTGTPSTPLERKK